MTERKRASSSILTDKTTIIECQMGRIDIQLSLICQNLIDNIPVENLSQPGAFPIKTYRYFEKFFENDYNVMLAFQPLTYTTAEIPLEVFTIIDKALPHIDVTEKGKLPKTKINFQERLTKVKWDDITTRCAIALFIDFIEATFVYNTLKLVDTIEESEVNEILGQILRLVVNPKIPKEEMQYRPISARKWSLALQQLCSIQSEVCNKYVVELISDVFNKGATMSHDERSVRQALFSHVDVGKMRIDQLDNMLSNVGIIRGGKGFWYHATRPSLDHPAHETAIEFLTNLYVSIFENSPDSRKSTLLKHAYDKVNEIAGTRNYSGPACAARAKIFSYNQCPKLKMSTQQYCDNFIKPRILKQPGSALQEAAALLRQPRSDIPGTFIDYMYGVITTNAECFRDYQKELSEFLTGCFNFSPNKFINRLHSDFSQAKFAEWNSEALFEAAFQIIRPEGILSGAEADTRECESAFKELITNELFKTSKGAKETAAAFEVMSFVDSLCVHGSPDVAVALTAQESLPQPLGNYSSAGASLKVSKWQKLVEAHSKSFDRRVFEVSKNNISVFGSAPTRIPPLVYAIHTLPHADGSGRTAKDVASHIFDSNALVSAAAIRALQTIIAKAPEQFNHVAATVMNAFKGAQLQQPSLSTGILAVRLILESAAHELQEPAPSLLDAWNALVLLGLCAESPQIRGFAIASGEKIAALFPRYKSHITELIKEVDAEVSELGRKWSICAARFGEYEMETVQEMRFAYAAGGAANSVYGFYLAALMRKLRATDLLPEAIVKTATEFLRTTPANALGVRFAIVVAAFATTDDDDYYKASLRVSEAIGRTPHAGHAFFIATEPGVFVQFLNGGRTQSQLYEGALFALRCAVASNDIVVSAQNLQLIFDFLANMREYFSEHDVKYKAIKSTRVGENNPVAQVLNAYLEFARVMFEVVYEQQASIPASIFAMVPSVLSDLDFKLDTDPWFFLILNLVKDSVTTENAQRALAALLSIQSMPDECFDAFLGDELFPIFEAGEPTLLSRFLSSSSGNEIAKFVDEARRKPVYFHALAELFPGDSVDVVDVCEQSTKYFRDPKENESAFCAELQKVAGRLEAISFFYLVQAETESKASAFRILRSISLGICVVFYGPEVAAEVVHAINGIVGAVYTQLSGFSIDPAIRLSEELCELIPAIGEQFVSELLQMAPQCPTMAQIAAPWLRRVMFESSGSGKMKSPVLVGTADDYRVFTPYTFTEQLLKLPKNIDSLRLLRYAIEGQAEESLDVAHFITVDIMLGHVAAHTDSDEFLNTLAYLFMVKPTVVLADTMKFLSYSYWHHAELAAGRFEALFDIDKFLEDTGKDDEELDPREYEQMINFVLQTLLAFADQTPDAFEPYVPMLLVFAVLNWNQFEGGLQNLLSLVAPVFFSGESAVVGYLRGLGDERNGAVMRECLAWGLCCGNLALATRALRLYVKAATTLPTGAVIEKAERSINIVAQCLYEKSNGQAQTTSRQWLYHMVDVSHEADWATACAYIASAFDLITASVENASEVDAGVLWHAVRFLGVKSLEFAPVLNAALRTIIAVLSKKGTREQIRREGRPGNTDGILTMLSYTKFDESTPSLLFAVTSLLERSNLYDIALTDPAQGMFVFSAIHTLANITGASELEKKGFLATRVVAGTDAANTAFRLFGQIALKTKGAPQQLIFDYCANAMTMWNVEIEPATVSILAEACISSFGTTAADTLLRIIGSSGGCVEAGVGKRPGMPVFPQFARRIDLGDDFHGGDCFADPARFPPLFVSDTGFYPCPIELQTHAVVARAPAAPFTEWYGELFSWQSAFVVGTSAPVGMNIDSMYFRRVRNAGESPVRGETGRNPQQISRGNSVIGTNSNATSISREISQTQVVKRGGKRRGERFLPMPELPFAPDVNCIVGLLGDLVPNSLPEVLA